MSEPIFKTEFDSLPEEIHKWLRSEAADSIVKQLNERYSLLENQLDAVPCIASWIPMLWLKPEDTVPSLIDDFAISPEIATPLAKDIEHLLFAPIKLAMRQKLGVDIEKMVPAATQAIKPQESPKMVDIKTPSQTIPISRVSSSVPIQKRPETATPPKPAGPTAGTLRAEKPIGLSEILPKPPDPHELVEYKDEHPVVEK